MDWGKVVYVFFTLMSLTSTAAFLFDHTSVMLFVAASLNLISTILKLGVRNLLAAELLAGSLVADLHLIPAFIYMEVIGHVVWATALAIGALIANVFSIIMVFIESAKAKENYE
ncbi:DUF6394 family protein [Sulfuricurvum sp.]|uniref:DUF6394 family protein n=1 Tax=Sulfuricurvum sp. TaxID=2025608 RepID=UPI003BAE83B3